MSKRKTFIYLACLVLLLLFTACSGQKSAPPATPGATTTSQQTAKALAPQAAPDWQKIILGLEDMPAGLTMDVEKLGDDSISYYRVFVIASPNLADVFAGKFTRVEATIIKENTIDSAKQRFQKGHQATQNYLEDAKQMSFPKLGDETLAYSGKWTTKGDDQIPSMSYPVAAIEFRQGLWLAAIVAKNGSANDLEALGRKQLEKLPKK